MAYKTTHQCTPLSGIPDPSKDWLDQRQLAEIFGVSSKTASKWARLGRLEKFEHLFPQCGHRKYSRTLVERAMRRCWEQAVGDEQP